jgi:hypothetical protein
MTYADVHERVNFSLFKNVMSHYLMIPSLLLYFWLRNNAHGTTPMLLKNDMHNLNLN